MQLFDYQTQFIKDIYQAIKYGEKRIVCNAPTGAGKTVVMSQIAQHIVKSGKTLLILVHLDVLVPQTVSKLHAFGLEDNVGVIKAGYKENPECIIQVASLQTIGRRKRWLKHFDVVIFDEAHQTSFHTVGKKIITEYCKDSIILGFTATPVRLSRREGMRDFYSTIVRTLNTAELQSIGRLAKMRYFSISGADLSKVRTQMGDFKLDDLRIVCDDHRLIDGLIEQWFKHCPNKRTLAFCVSIDHAKHTMEAFGKHVPSAMVTGDTPKGERYALYKALGQGEIQVLTSVNVVSIGFDVPNVEVGLLMRPTKSSAMHFQQVGRIMRSAPGKEFGMILDQAGNCLRHGVPEEIDCWELDEAKKKSNGDAPAKVCPECGAINLTFAMKCVGCGYEFPRKDPMDVSHQLEEISIGSVKMSRKQRFYRSRLSEAYRKNYNPRWAFFKYKEHYQEPPSSAWRAHSVTPITPTDEHYQLYYSYLSYIQRTRDKSMMWLTQEFHKEFNHTLEAKQWFLQRSFLSA